MTAMEAPRMSRPFQLRFAGPGTSKVRPLRPCRFARPKEPGLELGTRERCRQLCEDTLAHKRQRGKETTQQEKTEARAHEELGVSARQTPARGNGDRGDVESTIEEGRDTRSDGKRESPGRRAPLLRHSFTGAKSFDRRLSTLWILVRTC